MSASVSPLNSSEYKVQLSQPNPNLNLLITMFSTVAPVGFGLLSCSVAGLLPESVEVLPTFEEFVAGLGSDSVADVSDIFAPGPWNCTLEYARRVDLELGDTTLVAASTFDEEDTLVFQDSLDYRALDFFNVPGSGPEELVNFSLATESFKGITYVFCDTPCPVRHASYIPEVESVFSRTDSNGHCEVDYFNSEADLQNGVNLIRSNAIRRGDRLVNNATLARRNAIRLPKQRDEQPVTLVRRNAIKRANRG